jgi:hypothetical protein
VPTAAIRVASTRMHRGAGRHMVGELTLCRMESSWMLRRVALVRTDFSEERSASFIRGDKIQ